MQKLRSIPPARLSLLLAALVLFEGLGEYVLTTDAAGSDLALGAVSTVLSSVGVAVAYRYPFVGVLLGASALWVTNLLPREIVEGTGGAWLVSILLVFWMALRVDGRALAWRLLATYAFLSLQALTDQYPFNALDFVFGAVILVGGPAALGHLLRSRARLADALREKAEHAERTRALEAETAVAEERERIAGELHDVVAHALGAMTVQASAARRLTERDPEKAIGAFHAVEDTGRAALGELRRLLGVLRREDEELALAPQPKLAYVGDLARRSSAAGLPVELAVEGDAPDALPAGVDLTGYRVVQEALRDAMNIGGAGRANVTIRYAGGSVEIEVRDDGRGRDRPMLGLQERLRVYGGQLRSERSGDGYRVLARLPLEAAA